MDSLLTAIPWETIGPGGVLFLAVILIIRGDLVPRRTHDAIVTTHKDTVAVERAANAELRQALRILATEHGTTADKILSALPLPDREDDHA